MFENIKVGDKVIVDSWNRSAKIACVQHITSTGLLKVNNRLYYRDGRQRSSDPFHISTIREFTEEEYEIIMQSNYIRETMNKLQNLNELSYLQAVEINKILNKKEE